MQPAEPPLGGTIDHIITLLPSLLPSSQRVAKVCIERPEDVVNMAGSDLAEAAGTSPATVSRTAQALGFRGFQHLRLLLMRDLGARGDQPSAAAGTAGLLQRLAEDAGTMLQHSLASVDPRAFERAAAAIADAPRVLLVGSGGSRAAIDAMAIALAMNGRPCEAPSDGVAQQITARVLAASDVCLVVSASGANAVTLTAAKAAREAGALVIGATCFAQAPLAALCDVLLVAGARFHVWDSGTVASSLAQILLLSALQMAVAERMRETVDRIRPAVRDEILGLVSDEPTGRGS